MPNQHVRQYEERLNLALREDGVKLNKLLAFDTTLPMPKLNDSLILGFGIKDGYLLHQRTGMKLLDEKTAKALVANMQDFSRDHINHKNSNFIKELSDELRIDHMLVAVNSPKLMVVAAYVNVLKDHEIPRVLENKDYFAFTKDMYKKVSEILLSTLKQHGHNPAEFQYDYLTKAELEKSDLSSRVQHELKKVSALDTVVSIFQKNPKLSEHFHPNNLSYDVTEFDFGRRMDNIGIIKFNNVGPINEKEVAKEIVATAYHYLKQNGGSEELQSKLAGQYNNTLLHQAKYQNYILFADSKTINLNDQLIKEILKIEEKKAIQPRSDMQQTKNINPIQRDGEKGK